jgi:hypothetical protein
MAPARDNEGFHDNITERTERGWPTANSEGFRILEQPYGTRRKLRVIHIGGGASGICFSRFAEQRLQNVELQIYEKNKDVGGTWLENRSGVSRRRSRDADCASDIQDVRVIFLLLPTSSPGRGIQIGRIIIRNRLRSGRISNRWLSIMIC